MGGRAAAPEGATEVADALVHAKVTGGCDLQVWEVSDTPGQVDPVTHRFGSMLQELEVDSRYRDQLTSMLDHRFPGAHEEIKEIGPDGMFIGTDRTVELMQDGAFMPDVADRETRQTWLEMEGDDAQATALKRAREILDVESESLFSPDVESRIRDAFEGMVVGDLKPIEAS